MGKALSYTPAILRLLMSAALVAGLLSACATQQPERRPLLLFCTGGTLDEVQGILCAEPDVARELLKRGPRPQNFQFPKPSIDTKDKI